MNGDMSFNARVDWECFENDCHDSRRARSDFTCLSIYSAPERTTSSRRLTPDSGLRAWYLFNPVSANTNTSAHSRPSSFQSGSYGSSSSSPATGCVRSLFRNIKNNDDADGTA